jgi:hypothetical protein
MKTLKTKGSAGREKSFPMSLGGQAVVQPSNERTAATEIAALI